MRSRRQPAKDGELTRRDCLWAGYTMFGVALTVGYFLFPRFQWQLWTVLGLSAVAATVVGVRRHRPRQPMAWYLLAAAEFCFIAGDTSYAILTKVIHESDPLPSIADFFYLLTYPLFAAGIFLIIRARSTARDTASLIDAVGITLGLSLLSWVYLIVPNIELSGLDVVQRSVAVAYPLGDVLVLAMLVRLVAGGSLRLPSMVFLVVGAVGLLGADVMYGLIQLSGVWKTGGPVDIGWVIFYVAWGAAALHPSMRRLSRVVSLPSVRMSRSRISILALASLIAPGVLLVQSVTHQTPSATAIALFSAALFLLVLARMAGILSVYAQSAKRERALRSCSEALVGAQRFPDIYQIAVLSANSLIGAKELDRAAIYLTDAGGINCVASSSASRPFDNSAEMWAAAQAGGYLSQSGTLSINPLRYDGQDRGMLVVETSRSHTVGQHQALATLAAQVALAIGSATLAEQLRQRQSQEQFRGMIQNASDIILLVDERGTISYGTPSLERQLGYPIDALIGTSLTRLMHPQDTLIAEAILSGMVARSPNTPSLTDWQLRHADGRYLSFEVVTSNLLDLNSVGGVVLTMRDVTQRRALEKELKHQAFHDRLTGLPNRALFQDRLEHALTRAVRRGTAVAMAIVDLDDFKLVNDLRGHASGDGLLNEVGHRLQSQLGRGFTVARLGGDEFAILIDDIDDDPAGSRFADRIMQQFNAPYAIGEEELAVSASVGVVVASGSEVALDLTDVLRCADLALYAAKEHGKGRAELYRGDLQTRMVNRLAQRSELSAALRGGQFELRYQPVVLIDTGEIRGSEVLVRWRHPTRGLVSPAEFIVLAEETGQIVELGRWILDQACAQWRTWADRGYADHRLSVNVSVRQLQEPGFVEEVRSTLLRHRVAHNAIVLEVTESMFALDTSILRRLSELRDLGVKIAVDDFGTGYSSLSYLQQFQVDIIKIDKCFVDGLAAGRADGGTLVEAIVSLAHSLRLEVIAEGIETAGQRDLLWSIGCELGQGYLYAKPIPAEEMLGLLDSAESFAAPESAVRWPATPLAGALRILG